MTLGSTAALRTLENGQSLLIDSMDVYLSPAGNDTTGDGTEGSPWLSLNRVSEHFSDVYLARGVTVNVHCLDGVYEYDEEQRFTHIQASRFRVIGTTILSPLISVQSASGTSPNISLVLNVFSTENVEVGDYYLITSTYNGINPSSLVGCWEITNVDTVNSRITIAYKTRGGSSSTKRPSSSVHSDTARVIKCVWEFTGSTNGVIVESSGLHLEGIVVVGSSNSAATYSGITNTIDHVCLNVSYVGVSNFGIGYLSENSTLVATDFGCSSCYVGASCSEKSTIQTISGIGFGGNVTYGLQLNTFCCVYGEYAQSGHNGTVGIYVSDNSSINTTTCDSGSNGESGLEILHGSSVKTQNTTTDYNTSRGILLSLKCSFHSDSLRSLVNDIGIECTNQSSCRISIGLIAGNQTGIIVANKSNFDVVDDAIVSFNLVDGISVLNASSWISTTLTCTSNANTHLTVGVGSSAKLQSTTLEDSVYGLIVEKKSSIEIIDAISVTICSEDGISVKEDSTFVVASPAILTLSSIVGYALSATEGGYISIPSSTSFASVTNPTNLTINTEWSDLSYIRSV